MAATARLAFWMLLATTAMAESVDLTPRSGGVSDRVRVTTRLRYEGTITPEKTQTEAEPRAVTVSADQALSYQQEALESPTGVRRVVRVVEPIEAVRPNRRTLIAEEHETGARVASAGEPLNRAELDRLQLAADPLDLDALLPGREVREAGTWRVGQDASRRLLRLEEVSVCEVTGILTESNGSYAKLRFAGPVHGQADGAAMEIDLQGVALFDRRAGRISRLNLGWREKREVGPATPAIEVAAKLNLTIEPAGPIPAEDLLLAAASGPDWRIEVVTRDGRWRLLTDRRWFAVANNHQATTLRRLDGGRVTAMTTLMSAPSEGLSTEALESEVRHSLGERLTRIVRAEQAEADGIRRRTVESLGKTRGEPTIWRHDSLALPAGGSLAATTTLPGESSETAEAAVRQLIGSARPVSIETAAAPSGAPTQTF